RGFAGLELADLGDQASLLQRPFEIVGLPTARRTIARKHLGEKTLHRAFHLHPERAGRGAVGGRRHVLTLDFERQGLDGVGGGVKRRRARLLRARSASLGKRGSEREDGGARAEDGS